MKILVDADACPVKSIIEKVAKNFNIKVTMFIDTSHILESDYSEIIQVGQGQDAADIAIINNTQKLDIIVTGDYGVASLALAMGAYVISFNGMYYTHDNIDRLLFERHIGKQQRKAGKRNSRIKKRTQDLDINFENALIKLCKNKNEHL
ncbi:MAG TPA: YaiI/YqxD family protein [Clostridiales bacterium]|nr:YaiI/YqxD family protein [Clostridiales bacterium]